MSESINRWVRSQEHTRSHYSASGGRRARSNARAKVRAFDRTLADLEGSDRVLEVGSYHGLVHSLASTCAVGVDPLAGEADQPDRSIAHSTAGIGEALPFKSNTFDVVFSWNTLDHVIDPGGVIREIRRVLRSGGELLLCVNVYDVPRWMCEHFISRVGRNHPHYFRPDDVRAVAQDGGFQIDLDRVTECPVDVRKALRQRDILSLGSAVCRLKLHHIRCSIDSRDT